MATLSLSLFLSLRNNHVVLIIREAAVWCLSALHGLGQTLWFPAVSERPQRQLRRLEGNLHRQQQRCKCIKKYLTIVSGTTAAERNQVVLFRGDDGQLYCVELL